MHKIKNAGAGSAEARTAAGHGIGAVVSRCGGATIWRASLQPTMTKTMAYFARSTVLTLICQLLKRGQDASLECLRIRGGVGFRRQCECEHSEKAQGPLLLLAIMGAMDGHANSKNFCVSSEIPAAIPSA